MGGEMILVVDDEKSIVDIACAYLQKDGFAVESARDGEEAVQKIVSLRPSLVVLDLMLPKLDGWEVCRLIRSQSEVPIIMLTARSEDVDKIVGLEMGADEYLTKPFDPRELVARVKAVLRRSVGDTEPCAPISIGSLVIDPKQCRACVRGALLELRSKGFDVLLALARHRGGVMSREQLLHLVWGYDFYGETRTVDVHVAHIRSKLQGSGVTIETVWGVGYKLVETGESQGRY